MLLLLLPPFFTVDVDDFVETGLDLVRGVRVLLILLLFDEEDDVCAVVVGVLGTIPCLWRVFLLPFGKEEDEGVPNEKEDDDDDEMGGRRLYEGEEDVVVGCNRVCWGCGRGRGGGGADFKEAKIAC